MIEALEKLRDVGYDPRAGVEDFDIALWDVREAIERQFGVTIKLFGDDAECD